MDCCKRKSFVTKMGYKTRAMDMAFATLSRTPPRDVPETRAEFDNRDYYKHSDKPDEGIATTSPSGSRIGSQTCLALPRVEGELERIFVDLRTMPLHVEFGGIGLPELLVVAVGFVLLWGVSRLKAR